MTPKTTGQTRISLIMALLFATSTASNWYGTNAAAADGKHNIKVSAKGPYLDFYEEFEITPPQGDSVLNGQIFIEADVTPLAIAVDFGSGYVPLSVLNGDTSSIFSASDLSGVVTTKGWDGERINELTLQLKTKKTIKLKFHGLQSPLAYITDGFLIRSILGADTPFRYEINTPDSSNWRIESGLVPMNKIIDRESPDTLYNLAPNRIWWTQLSGDLNGNYLWWQGILPDSVKNRFRKKSDLCILWRWNQPSAFFDAYGNLTQSGSDAIIQARYLENFSISRLIEGYGVGLVHSVFDETPKVYSIKKSKNDSLVDWLHSISSQFLRTKYSPNSTNYSRPAWAPVLAKKQQGELDSLYRHLQLAVAQFKDTAGILRHIMIISPDGDAAYNTSFSLDSVKSILQAATLQSYGKWQGLDLSNVQISNSKLDYTTDGTFIYPLLMPHSFSQWLTGDRKYEINPEMTLNVRSNSNWNSNAKVIAYNNRGMVVDSLEWTPQWQKIENDSNLVRIWARSTARYGGKALDSVEQKLKIIAGNQVYGFNSKPDVNAGTLTDGIINISTKNTSVNLDLGDTPLWNKDGTTLQLWLPPGQWIVEMHRLDGSKIGIWNIEGNQVWQLPNHLAQQPGIMRLTNRAGSEWIQKFGGLL